MEIKNSNQNGMETQLSGGFGERDTFKNTSSNDMTVEDEDLENEDDPANETNDEQIDSEDGDETLDLADDSDDYVDVEESEDDMAVDDIEEDDIEVDDVEDDDIEDVSENALDRK